MSREQMGDPSSTAVPSYPACAELHYLPSRFSRVMRDSMIILLASRINFLYGLLRYNPAYSSRLTIVTIIVYNFRAAP